MSKVNDAHPARRGPYAKGVVKREEILERALEVIDREGFAGASMKAIAEAAGIAPSGILHYFASKEELFTEVLRKRDELNGKRWAPGGGAPDYTSLRTAYQAVVDDGIEHPGALRLFTGLAADAADAEHPAHEFFARRGAGFRALWAEVVRDGQRAGEVTGDISPEHVARLLQAVSDGLQMQALLEPDLDMGAVLADLFALLEPPSLP